MTDAAQPPPKMFGKYSLLSRLAVGGMAELFLAKDSTADQLVVIKRIHPFLCQEERIAGMFLDEARIAAQLDHPNVIKVLELGRAEGSLFIAMEYVEGVDLWQTCEEVGKEGQTLSYEIAAYVVAQICAGLDHAHNRRDRDGRPLNIVHRDVNPMNVMVGFDGSVKLVDFGIAKARTMIEQTLPGTVKGKYHYFSPEQVTEARVDARTDIFAIGITLYEITTGKNPFFRPRIDAVLAAIRGEDPTPPSQLRADYPHELEAIVNRCLMKDPGRRYQGTAEVQADLESFLNLADQRTAARALSQYMAAAFRRGEDPTLPFIPWSIQKAAMGDVLAIPALRGEAAQRPSPRLKEAAEAFQRGLASQPGDAFPAAAPLGTLPPTVRVGGAASLVARAARGDEEVTVARGSTGRRVLRNSAIALAMLVAAGLVWAGIALRAPPPLPPPAEALPKPEQEQEQEQELAAKNPAALEPLAAAPLEPDPAPAQPDPAPAPAITQVEVKFSGPAGMRITRNGKHHLRAGAVEQLKPGSYRLVYRCPVKRGKARYKSLTVTVPDTAPTMEVALSCRR